MLMLEKSYVNNLSSNLETRKKEQKKHKLNRRKEIIKRRAEIIEIKKRTVEKIDHTRTGFLKRLIKLLHLCQTDFFIYILILKFI